jgi:hypothetical protein
MTLLRMSAAEQGYDRQKLTDSFRHDAPRRYHRGRQVYDRR